MQKTTRYFRRYIVAILTCLLFFGASRIFVVPSKAAVAPELPRVYIDTTYPALASGRTVRSVKSSCSGVSNCTTSLQTAIDQAALGDEIVVDAGLKVRGPIVLKNKTTGSGWIVIRTSNLSGISQPGTRISPSQASAMPKIEAPGSNENALETEDRAHNYRLVGIEFREAVPSSDANVFVQLGSLDSYCATVTEPYKVCDTSVLANYAYNITLDRVYIHGDPSYDSKRGVGLDSKDTAIIDSYISDIHVVGQDSQAIGSFNGPGPYKIVNNYLEASTENIIFGGDDPRVQNLTASDIEIRGNYLYKPLSWREGSATYAGKHWAVKNLFELKNAARVIVDGNVMENNWSDAQPGVAVLINTTNQNGRCPWCAPTDVTFSNNIIAHSGGGMSFQANDYNYPASTGRTARIRVYNNLWYDLDGTKWRNLASGTKATDYLFYLPSGANEPGPDDIQIIHNTGFASGTMVSVDKNSGTTFFTKSGFVFKDNIAAHNTYGIFGPGTSGLDQPTIASYFPGAVVTKNVIMGQRSSTDTRDWSANYTNYPGNYFPKTWTDVGFTDMTANNYALTSASIYSHAASDGKDVGADVTSINSMTSGVKLGTITPGPTPPPPTAGLDGDINMDHIVNSLDYSILNSHWFSSDTQSDLNHDGLVNALDFSLLNNNWLKTW
ncbi:MAG: dockerin type I repeat-containing protein [Candidatus Doudnabacteria bacterium]|nr:dockerin type I repeat-containing protein [Candidatus Doudnabacteria bacterium]